MIQTYNDYLLSNPNILPEQLQRNGLKKYLCPTCNSWKWAGLIVDVRALAIAEDWACDGCWTHWERTGRKIDTGELDPQDRREWRLRWAIAHEQSLETLQNISMTRGQEKYKKR